MTNRESKRINDAIENVIEMTDEELAAFIEEDNRKSREEVKNFTSYVACVAKDIKYLDGVTVGGYKRIVDALANIIIADVKDGDLRNADDWVRNEGASVIVLSDKLIDGMNR